MTGLQPYQGESPSYFCMAWNGMNEHMLYPARYYYDVLAFIPLAIKAFSYVALARGAERVNQGLQSNVVTNVLSNFFLALSINLLPTFSNMGYESKCFYYLPEQQKRFKEISQTVLNIIKASEGKTTNLASNYETIYLDPNIAKSRELISSAVLFLKEFFPKDSVLDQKEILDTKILAGYFKDLKEDNKYKKTDLELKIINYWLGLFDLID